MMSAIREAMLAAGNSPAATLLVKATAAVALGLVPVRIARNCRAAVRHALLAATFGVLLALPLVSVLAPPVAIVVQTAPPERTSVPLALPAGVRTVAPSVASQTPGISVSTLLL